MHRARPTRCHELPLRSAGELRDRGVHATGCQEFGCVAVGYSDSLYAVHRQSRRPAKGAVSQPLLRRLFRRLLLIFVPPIRPFTVLTGHLSLGSCKCIVCPKTCCENRGQIWKVALFSTGAIEHWEHNRALSEQWSSAYYGK